MKGFRDAQLNMSNRCSMCGVLACGGGVVWALGFEFLAFGSWLLTLDSWLLAFGFWLLAFGFWLSGFGERWAVGGRPKP